MAHGLLRVPKTLSGNAQFKTISCLINIKTVIILQSNWAFYSIDIYVDRWWAKILVLYHKPRHLHPVLNSNHVFFTIAVKIFQLLIPG